jgi:hypothetical protein
MIKSFMDYIKEADSLFEERQFAAARDVYLAAIALEPNHLDVFRAIARVELLDGLLIAKDWYGAERPRRHAISVFGSVAEDGASPYIHYSFYGLPAYEAFTASYYLQDLFRLRRFARLVQPAFMLLYLAAQSIKARRIEFLELESTLYAAYQKFQNCENALVGGQGWRLFRRQSIMGKMRFLGVEISSLLRQLSLALHHDVPITIYKDWRDVPAPEYPRLSMSLGVCNYAFEDSTILVRWLQLSRLSVIRERFVIGRGDTVYHVLGKRFTCFDLEKMPRELATRGLKLSILSFTEAVSSFPEDELPLDGSILVDANILVHALTENEAGTLVQLLEHHEAERFRSNYNTNPPFSLTSDAIFVGKAIDEIKAAFPGPRVYRPAHRNILTDSRFDFSSSMLAEALEAHLRNLARVYG